MTTIAFRVPVDLKNQMAKVKINWSEYIRRSIQEAIVSENKRHWFSQLKQGARRHSTPGTAARIIRSMRDHG
jgi:hypothetical protein